MADPVALFTRINFESFRTAFEVGGNFVQYTANSLLYAVTASLLSVLLWFYASFPISRGYVKAAGALYVLLLATYLLPEALIPQFQLLLRLKLYNTKLGYILLRTGTTGMAFLLTVGYIKTTPRDYDEAAGLEGCSAFRYLHQVLIPMCRPVLAAAFIIQVIPIWNDIIGAIVFLTSRRNYPAVRGLYRFFGEYATNWPALSAAIIITSAPLVAIFVALQKQIVEGVTAVGIKG
jgi:raffinose/stachyose/melibiose transport system permease protein